MKGIENRLSRTAKKRIACRYLLYLPKRYKAEGGKGFPLLLFLHGAGERGDDLERVKVHGPPRLIEAGKNLPFVVVAPQCPAGEWWTTDVLDAVLREVVEKHNIDEGRIYVSGLSMGGYGTWLLANQFPNRFAAIAPICGPFVWVNAENFKSLPVWCFHGAMDEVVPIQDSIKMVKMLRRAGCDVRFTVYPDAEHDSWTETYNNEALYEWLLQHKRSG